MTITLAPFGINHTPITQQFLVKSVPKKNPDILEETANLKLALSMVNTSVCHSINNALTPIICISAYLQSRTDDPEITKAMDVILASATTIKNTVANMKELENKEFIRTTQYLPGIQMLDLHSQG